MGTSLPTRLTPNVSHLKEDIMVIKEEQEPTKELLKWIQTSQDMTIEQLWIIYVLINGGHHSRFAPSIVDPNSLPIVALDRTRNYAPVEGLVRADQREHKRQPKENCGLQ